MAGFVAKAKALAYLEAKANGHKVYLEAKAKGRKVYLEAKANGRKVYLEAKAYSRRPALPKTISFVTRFTG